MQRVLVNLVTNAIESLREGSGPVPPRCDRLGAAGRQRRAAQVGDNGAGIAPDEIDHIFDPFVTTKAAGTGLGLPLCRTIVEDHGGRLWASQREPHGASFHLRLPRSGAVAVASGETDEFISNLEGSLRWLRRTKSDEVTDVIAELQHIVDEVRDTMRKSER
jgi:nitrogen-specific signal transduction histidine kinase